MGQQPSFNPDGLLSITNPVSEILADFGWVYNQMLAGNFKHVNLFNEKGFEA